MPPLQSLSSIRWPWECWQAPWVSLLVSKLSNTCSSASQMPRLSLSMWSLELKLLPHLTKLASNDLSTPWGKPFSNLVSSFKTAHLSEKTMSILSSSKWLLTCICLWRSLRNSLSQLKTSSFKSTVMTSSKTCLPLRRISRHTKLSMQVSTLVMLPVTSSRRRPLTTS